ncbi:MAG: hypothetical protein KDD33_03255 [Bdellovibrionales bacterium]|nr:hypothetical protein [Bdellovibrionales bacterium]
MFSRFVAIVLLVISATFSFQAMASPFRCQADLGAISNDSSFLLGPRVLTPVEQQKAIKLLNLAQENMRDSLMASAQVMQELGHCYAEMGTQWQKTPGPQCQSFANYQTKNYQELIYKKIPIQFKSMRVNLALAIKPKHKQRRKNSLWNHVNKDLNPYSGWPEEITTQEPLISGKNQELDVALEILDEALRNIVFTFVKKIETSQLEDDQILYQILLSSLVVDDPEKILNIVERDLYKFKGLPIVDRWFHHFYTELGQFREQRMKKVKATLNIFRPIAKIGKALPVPQDFATSLQDMVKINLEIQEKINGEMVSFRKNQDFFKVDQLFSDSMERTDFKNFINPVVIDHPELCDVAHLLYYRNEIAERNSTIEYLVAGLAFGIYARVAVATAGFLGLSIYEIYNGQIDVDEQRKFFFSQPTTDGNLNQIAMLDESQDRLSTAYYLLPLAFVGTPLIKGPSRLVSASLEKVKNQVKSLKPIGHSQAKSYYRYEGFHGERGILIRE